MNRLVCVDNDNRFYLPVNSILCVAQRKNEEDEVPVNGYTDYVEITYALCSEIKTYKIYMGSYSISTYCKSLQAHINVLMI